ncbi:hypothetical protein DLJ59_11035 [Micromonospora inaquosa]|uniref:Uncharacterized protein n=1 Tax=Micromonospora inaquosa TaxID=2203716 RepID=A0A3N9WT15_9ACTN|nr:hypothetical protein DLJ59_11035 [Micromonospora inaquosa]
MSLATGTLEGFKPGDQLRADCYDEQERSIDFPSAVTARFGRRGQPTQWPPLPLLMLGYPAESGRRPDRVMCAHRIMERLTSRHEPQIEIPYQIGALL